MEAAIPLAAVIIAMAGFAWGVLQMRSHDLRLIEDRRKEDREALERRLDRTEGDLKETRVKLDECERARTALQSRELDLLRRLVAVEQKVSEGGQA